MKKERLDKILADLGYFETKSRSQAAIMAGSVKVDGAVITKAGFMLEVKDDTVFEIKHMPYVSRGGFKLEKALKEFKIDLKGRICLDAGASTGGFTDCMLQNGAEKVYSADTGYGQLAWKLRINPRVKVIEKVNIKNCPIESIYSDGDKRASFIAADLSFISLKKVLPNLVKLADPSGFEIAALIKPQFEAGREQADKNKGIVKEKEIHIQVIKDIIEYAESISLYAENTAFSPVKGAKGNIEYLIHLSPEPALKKDINIENIINEAHQLLVNS